jgi:putative transposase
MKRKPYPSDVTDQQWALIESLLPRPPRRPRPGRPREVDLREVVNALFYHAREFLRTRGHWPPQRSAQE